MRSGGPSGASFAGLAHNEIRFEFPGRLPRRLESPDNVSALQRGFAVLECFAGTDRPLGNGDIARSTGIPRPTVSRLIATLVALGHLRPARETDKYELAAGVVRLAKAFLARVDVRRWARPHVSALAEATGMSSFLAVRDGHDMLVVEASRSRAALMLLGTGVGSRLSLATSALGRGWLAAVDEATRARAIAALSGDARIETAATGAALERAFNDAMRRGYAVSIGEWHAQINSVAVPVRTPGGWPSRPVRLIVPFTPGGPTDTVARLVAQHLQELWKQTVLVDYKPGAGTIVGTDFVARSAPDGYTLGMAISAHMINPSLQPSLPYDTSRDLVGVSQVALSHFGLFAHPSLDMAGIDMVHVPYKGSSPAQQDVVAGRVPLLFDVLFSAMPFVKQQRLKLLAL